MLFRLRDCFWKKLGFFSPKESRKFSKKGTLFIDTDSPLGKPNSNTIIYGHNMKDQSMFGSLKNYAKKSYFHLFIEKMQNKT